MKSIGYYPGCSLSGTAAEYDRSLRAIAQRLHCELKEVPQWLCCGATSAHAVDHTAALCLAADTLAKARHAGLEEILAPCAMCFQRLASAAYEMSEHPALARRVAAALGEPANLGMEEVRPLSILNWLANLPEEELTACVSKPLKGLKVACYYGCLLVRPERITGIDSVESPRTMERIVLSLGAQPVRWSMALECCGGSFAVSRKDVVLRQGKRIYQAAKDAGADVVCLGCPMCHSNLDLRQLEFVTNGGGGLPVLYLTQLIGLAMGIAEDSLGLKAHFVPAEPVLASALAR